VCGQYELKIPHSLLQVRNTPKSSSRTLVLGL
jgi:hypothetical protein